MTEPITGARIRDLFLEFFRTRGHAILPSASLVPANDPSALFTTAGMHPLVPYLLGQPHPLGRRLANAQQCIRTGDIDRVGDATHLTFFEMLGNWSLGDYFKEEAIDMSFEFLTSDRWLGLPVDRLAITCFAGDADAPRDTESARLWQRRGIPPERIFYYGKEDNWWGPPGKTGPCGPDTEMFIDTGRGAADAVPGDASGRFVEVWNDVFMEYRKTDQGAYEPLPQKNVDTGLGLERAVMTLAGTPSVYDTDLFAPLVQVVRAAAPGGDERTVRLVCDHLRAATFILADPADVVPSNVEHGYVLRRLLRRALRALQVLKVPPDGVVPLLRASTGAVASTYGDVYPEVRDRRAHAEAQLVEELGKYLDVARRAERLLAQRRQAGGQPIGGAEAFTIYQESGAHPDLLRSLGSLVGITVDLAGFEAEFAKHQERSRAGSTHRFQGGLADHSERTVRMHTATHLLHEALRRVLGTHVQQKGSNITPERLRFDFSHGAKLTADEIRRIEELVNEQVGLDLAVTKTVMSPKEARDAGALGFFGEKYGDQVNVYTIGEFSKEICGGPHVSRTGMVGRFRILKEEGLSAGVRRIRAVVE